MFEIVFLGTSASAPSIYRGLSSLAILAGEDRFLIDCGEGTQRQILRSGIGFKRLNRIFLTHSHLDHILGLGGLVSTFVRWENMDEIFIWGGKRTLERIETLIFEIVLGKMPPPIPIHMLPVQDEIVYQGKNFTIRAFPVVHRGPDCYGYILQEDSHRPFNADKATELGVPFGPERSQLVKGNAITLADGRVIEPDMVLGEEIRGVKMVFTGDIGRLDLIANHAADADVLVTESTFLDVDKEAARQFGHITAKEAAEFAKAVGVKTLMLTHVSRRYREFEVVREAREIFPNTIVVRDLDHFGIRRGQDLVRIERPQEGDDNGN